MRPTLRLAQKLLVLTEQDVRHCLDMEACLKANRQALVALASHQARVPTRLGLEYYNKKNTSEQAAGGQDTTAAADWTLFKPAALDTASDGDENVSKSTELMGLKVVSVRANNPLAGLPLVPATIFPLNAETGQVEAVVAGTYLTAARTAAGSALATALARPDARHVVVFGAGLQAACHVHAIATALQRPLQQVTVVNRTLSRAQALQLDLLNEPEQTQDCQVVALSDHEGVTQALSTADVVVTATNTSTPLFTADQLPPGRPIHINGIGSYTPQMQEVPTDTVAQQCRQVWMDTPEAVEVGDLCHALALQALPPATLLGTALLQQEQEQQQQSLSSSVPDSSSSNSNKPCVTFYKAVGTAIQDVVSADVVVKRARQLGRGVEVDMK